MKYTSAQSPTPPTPRSATCLPHKSESGARSVPCSGEKLVCPIKKLKPTAALLCPGDRQCCLPLGLFTTRTNVLYAMKQTEEALRVPHNAHLNRLLSK